MISIDDIYKEYSQDNSIFSEEDERTKKIKNIIFNDLDEIERRIILMYAETQSLRKLGKELNVSTTTAFYKIKEIKEKILQLYDNTTTPTDTD